jgi:hypothetical protein
MRALQTRVLGRKRWLLAVALTIACNAHDAPAPRSDTSGVNPFATHAAPPEQRRWIEGSVEERLVAGSYVYLRLRTSEPDETLWVASLAGTTPEAWRVRVLVLGSAEHFHSRRLNRDFDTLLFGAVRAASLALAVSTKGTAP